MTLFIFFALVFATIVLSILINRLVHCPILVGFAFFSVALLVAIIFSSTTLIIIAIILGIVAFVSAFLDCVITRSGFFRNNCCLRCDSCNNNCNCGCGNNNDDTLTIVNANGDVVARINGNSVSCNNNNDKGCGCGCGNNTILTNGNILDTTSVNNGTATTSSCGCNSRYYRCRR